MSSIFSKKDFKGRVLIPKFQGDVSLYCNNEQQIGFLDSEVYFTYPELKHTELPIFDVLSIKDETKRNIFLILKHSKWISRIIVK
jgi:hypothetical protein